MRPLLVCAALWLTPTFAQADNLRIIAAQIAEADLLPRLCSGIEANGSAIMLSYREHFANRDRAANTAWNEGRIDAQGTMIARLTEVVAGTPLADVCKRALAGPQNPFVRMTNASDDR